MAEQTPALWFHDGIIEACNIVSEDGDKSCWISGSTADGMEHIFCKVPGEQLPIRGSTAAAAGPYTTSPRHAVWLHDDRNVPVIFYGPVIGLDEARHVWIEDFARRGFFGVPENDVDLRRAATKEDVQSLGKFRDGILSLSRHQNNIDAIIQVYDCLLDNPALDQIVAHIYADNLRDGGNVAVLETVEGFYGNLGNSINRYIDSESMRELLGNAQQYLEIEAAKEWSLPPANDAQMNAFLQAVKGLSALITTAWDERDIDLKLAITQYGRLLQSNPAYAGAVRFRRELKAFDDEKGPMPKALKIATIIDVTLAEFADMRPKNLAGLVRQYGGQNRTLPI
jgi:hypothetical protein